MAKFYVFSRKTKDEVSDAVVTSAILICDRMATVLFDPGSTYSYVLVKFALGFDMVCDLLLPPSMFLPLLESMSLSPMGIVIFLFCLWVFGLGLIWLFWI
uniref:Putative ovule protein n=1 Tax=Solanum chacoense TaxID=4108 RepID=A0A0V0IIM4_SOLCH